MLQKKFFPKNGNITVFFEGGIGGGGRIARCPPKNANVSKKIIITKDAHPVISIGCASFVVLIANVSVFLPFQPGHHGLLEQLPAAQAPILQGGVHPLPQFPAHGQLPGLGGRAGIFVGGSGRPARTSALTAPFFLKGVSAVAVELLAAHQKTLTLAKRL